MQTNNLIEFYERRDIGESLSVTFRFIRENRKALLKYISILAIPLALIQAFFLFDASALQSLILTTPETELWRNVGPSLGIYLLIVLAERIIMSAFVGTLLKTYEEGRLTPAAKWKDFTHFTSFVGKTFNMMMLLIGLSILAIIALVIVMLIPILEIFVIILASVAFIAILPPLMLIFYPMYFEDMNAGQALKKGFILGWKNWGGTFVVALVLYIMVNVVGYLFSIPYNLLSVASIVGIGEEPFFGFRYFVSFLSALGTCILQPVVIIGLAFHYFSCREKAEQVSTQASVDNFENL